MQADRPTQVCRGNPCTLSDSDDAELKKYSVRMAYGLR